jgi:hypothetical protein
MKRHIHNPGGRKWFNDHIIELQSEAFKAIDAIASIHGAFVISGCGVTVGVDGTTIAPGIVCLRHSGTYKVMPFAGALVEDTVTTYYIKPQSTAINGDYVNPVDPIIAYNIEAVITAIVPAGTSGVDYFADVANGMPSYLSRLLTIVTSAGYLLPTTAQKNAWDGKLNATEVVSSPQASMVLRLNSSSKLPASITGDAQTLQGLTPTQISALSLQPVQLEFIKNFSQDTISGYATLVGSILTVSVLVDVTYINTGGVDKLFAIQGLSASTTVTRITLMLTDSQNPGVYTPIIGSFVGGVVSLLGQVNNSNITGTLSFSAII